MAASDITALSSLSATPASGDLFVLVDISDTSMDANGTTKKVTSTRLIDAVEANANTFTAANIFNSPGAATVPITINTAAAPSAVATQWQVNGTNRANLTLNATQSFLTLAAVDLGDDLPGPFLYIRRNTNATNPGAGALRLEDKNGNSRFIHVDAAGDVRVGATAVKGTTDTTNTVVGTQTSHAAYKEMVGPSLAIDGILASIQAAADTVKRFRYKSGSYGNQEFDGIVLDGEELHRYGMDADAEHPAGKSLNVINLMGDLLKAVSYLAERVADLEGK